MNRTGTTILAALLLSLAPGCKRTPGGEQRRLDELEARVKALQGLVPDQATVMTIQAYHFTNLWFAVEQENWPLAAFYLNETRKNLRWAVRIMPVRKNGNDADVNLAGIAESMENGQFSQMMEAIRANDKARAVKVYKDALAGCYACHEAVGRPYLRPRIPAAPAVQILAFDPGAKLPD